MIPPNVFLRTSWQGVGASDAQLLGYATTEDALIFQSSGLAAYLANGGDPHDIRNGRFIASLPIGAETVIRTDQTGQELLFLYQDGGDWAISNSFLLLVSEVATSKRLTLYPPALQGFHLKNGRHVGEQLVSHRTAVAEIKLVPALHDLVIDQPTGRLRQVARSFSQEAAPGDLSYEDRLLHFLERSAGFLAALADMPQHTNLMLSGGYDSRLVLQLLEITGRHRAVNISSDETRENDFRSACAVADRLGLEINTHERLRIGSASSSDIYRLWLMSCGCTYLPFYRLGNFTQEPRFELRLTGDQPTAWNHFHGQAQFNGTSRKVALDIEAALEDRPYGREVARDFIGVFDEIDFDPDHPRAMFAHYSAIRSRFHAGRNWYKALGTERTFTPLMDFDLVRLDLFGGMQGWPETKFFADAFSALGEWALETPFETPERAFDAALLTSSPFRGGVKITPRSIRVFGTYHAPVVGGAPSMMNLPLRIKTTEDDIKGQLAHSFWTAERARASGLFTKADLDAAKQEIDKEAALSVGTRKLSHIAMTEALLELLDMDGAAMPHMAEVTEEKG